MTALCSAGCHYQKGHWQCEERWRRRVWVGGVQGGGVMQPISINLMGWQSCLGAIALSQRRPIKGGRVHVSIRNQITSHQKHPAVFDPPTHHPTPRELSLSPDPTSISPGPLPSFWSLIYLLFFLSFFNSYIHISSNRYAQGHSLCTNSGAMRDGAVNQSN